SLESLQAGHAAHYAELRPEAYPTSLANPAHAVALFGDRFGQLFAFTNLLFRQFIRFALTGQIHRMERWNRCFIELAAQLDQDPHDYEALRTVITRPLAYPELPAEEIDLREAIDPAFSYFGDLVEHADLDDPRYLYRYPACIQDHDLRFARFMRDYPEADLRRLARLIAEGYVRGFEMEGKALDTRSTVRVFYRIGQERLVRRLVEELRERRLEPILSDAEATLASRQYAYDHRFDVALYLDEGFIERQLEVRGQAFERLADETAAFSGAIIIQSFGEPPFAPAANPAAPSLDAAQQRLFQRHQHAQMELRNRYLPRSETSFTIIAFPTPEIGDRFEEIFADTVAVNALDPGVYTGIQQAMIDVLDRSDHVHVRGRGDNATDLVVKLHALADPDRQTNFINCGADVNIPVGEVFTSPRLTGTSGVLHVEETYLRGLRYDQLRLTFEDGHVTAYDCANFETPEENAAYVRENLLFPHDTLPLGEFAIGTNTLAYVMARRHRILGLLPILITEKMGPHFAIGDTCFAHEEERPVFNPLDGKEMVARDNERSARRREDPQAAYTGRHTDITLPYASIGSITAVTAAGERTALIRDGRFVLPGTEALNEALDRAPEPSDPALDAARPVG
ncbi:MAG: aminopeptidase, partial [Candidatus Eiseniibacteriota bacterium]